MYIDIILSLPPSSCSVPLLLYFPSPSFPSSFPLPYFSPFPLHPFLSLALPSHPSALSPLPSLSPHPPLPSHPPLLPPLSTYPPSPPSPFSHPTHPSTLILPYMYPLNLPSLPSLPSPFSLPTHPSILKLPYLLPSHPPLPPLLSSLLLVVVFSSMYIQLLLPLYSLEHLVSSIL